MVTQSPHDKTTDISTNVISSPNTPTPNISIPDIPTKPPLLIESTLHLAWGLTLFLSTSDKQSSLANSIKDTLMASFTTNGLGDTDKRYVNNLVTIIASYLRRMGFEKDVYDRYLQTEKDRLQRKTDYWKNMGDMTSFSSESAIVKIASFFGIGTAGNTIKDILSPAKSASSSTSNVSNAIHGSIVNGTQSAFNTNIFSADSIGAIIIFGTIGLFAAIAFLKWFGNFRIDEETKRVNNKQDQYWKTQMRKKYRDELRILYDDIVELVRYYYPKFKDDPLINSEHSHVHTQDKLFERVIDEILPAELGLYTKFESNIKQDSEPFKN